jgi:hypothetical protein
MEMDMANQVYANGREVSCKAADGKTICAFPDVCFTPPQTPATPPGVPIPYPNTGLASDCTDGARSVKVSGQEVMLKNKSYFKTSTGDEAGNAPKKGVITSSNKGKVYFVAWSMDVKVEGENAVRHLDMTTGNHACPTANQAAPWTYADRMAMAEGINECDKAREDVKSKCKEPLDRKAECPPESGQLKQANSELRSVNKAFKAGNVSLAKKQLKEKEVSGLQQKLRVALIRGPDSECHRALQCFLTTYSPNRCCPGQTPDHLVEVASFLDRDNTPPGTKRSKAQRIAGWSKYKDSKAPCACAEGGATTLTHGVLSVRRGVTANVFAEAHGVTTWSLKDAAEVGAWAFTSTFRASGCDEECVKKQIENGHKNFQDDPNNPKDIKISSHMIDNDAWRDSAEKVMARKAMRSLLNQS